MSPWCWRQILGRVYCVLRLWRQILVYTLLIRKNFNLKPDTQLQKTHFNNGDNYTNEYIEVKEKL